jgi:3D (Asp-Asp-Asp) domain-containing protein
MTSEVEDSETKVTPSKLFFPIAISIALTVSCFAGAKYLRCAEEKKQTMVEPPLEVQEELASRGYIDRTIKLPFEGESSLVSTKTSLIKEMAALREEVREINQLTVIKTEVEEEVKEKVAMAQEPASTKEKSVPQVAKEEPAPESVSENIQTFTATAYDLSVQSCGKPIGHPQYGITRSGANIAGKTREQAMSIAVDPNVIPLGSQVKITFPEPYTHFNGVYTANDTGSAIKGKKIDIFMGDFGSNNSNQSVWDFGVREVKVQILK